MPIERKVSVEPRRFERPLNRKDVGKVVAEILFDVVFNTLAIVEKPRFTHADFSHVVLVCSFELTAQCGEILTIHPRVALSVWPRNFERTRRKIVKAVYNSFVCGDDEQVVRGETCNGKYCTAIRSGVIHYIIPKQETNA
jgi:hypothetical protein